MTASPHVIPGLSDFELIGRGGFGVVFRARQEELGRDVAVKVLSGSLLDERALGRFDRERRAMGSLSRHPGIVTIHDSGLTEAGAPYLVMELMERGSLADRLEGSGPLRWEEAVAVVADVADAVQEAHVQGVLHRDIKPENVLVDRYGHPKLSDFGIAALLEGTATATGSITATVEHVAPEILEGEAPSQLSDVYSLGSTLYALIAGLSPFRRSVDDSIAVILRRVVADPVPVLDGVTDELAALVSRCLSRDPAERPGSAAELAAELRVLLGSSHRVAAGPVPAGVDVRANDGGGSGRTRVIPRVAPEPEEPDSSGDLWHLIGVLVVLVVLLVGVISLVAWARFPEAVGGFRFISGGVAALILLGAVIVTRPK